MLRNRLNNISADVIFGVRGQYSFGGGRELNFHAKCIIGYKSCTSHL